MIEHAFTVDLADRSYPVYIGAGVIDYLGALCRKHTLPERVVVLSDHRSFRAAFRRVKQSLHQSGFHVHSIVMPPGEKSKTPARAAAIHKAMLREDIPRSCWLLALGGGVVGDVGGFVASTYRRGIPFVQCPTTLLSQVDSSIGGKNGVNVPPIKNAMGTFHQPRLVCSDVEVLSSLPRREVVAGLGEILKYPLVGDPDLLTYLEDHLENVFALQQESILEVALRCLRIKTGLVSLDEKETMKDAGRALLNTGHTIGHALENLSRYRLKHGEAVLLGLLAEGMIATSVAGFDGGDLDRIEKVFHRTRTFFNISTIGHHSLTRHIFSNPSVRFYLPERLGHVIPVDRVTESDVMTGLKYLESLLLRRWNQER